LRTPSFTYGSAGVRLVYLLTITRLDTAVIRVCTNVASIVIGGFTWIDAPGLKMGDIVERNDGTAGSCHFQVAMISGGSFDPDDVRNDKFIDAMVEIDITDGANPVTRDFRFLGTVGSVDTTSLDIVSFDLRNPFGFPRNILIRKYTAMCSADFGSFVDGNACRMPIHRPDVERSTAYALGDTARARFAGANTPEDYHNVYLEVTTAGTTASSAPSFNDTGTTTDGSVVWTARNAYERAARIASIDAANVITLDRNPDPRGTSDDTWYAPGRVLFESGYSLNRSERVGAWDGAAKQVTFYMPIGALIDVNDWVTIWPACDFTIAMCAGKYNNSFRFRGFPYSGGARFSSAPGGGVYTRLNTDSSGGSGPPISSYNAEAVECAPGVT
jgi:hypothetical protein